ncbi:MAG: molecular chaperone DnaJ [Candidatus Bipolaricaulota bacterium]|nr:molecular chaperone DnaJ [Candidatus Bipolaricaulota bacterium]MDW8126870.1 molecular chaperone DnaJ [Candidatus Bipolaricaulota bacterium]
MKMPPEDYYEILGVPRNATQEEIKRAFRRLAKQYHPDVYKGDKKEAERKFRKIAEAYEVLSDPVKRAQYDRFGHVGPEQSVDFGPEGFRRTREAFEEFFGPSAFEEIFNLFFGEGRRTRTVSRAQRGEDLEYRVRLTLEDAAFGTNLRVSTPRYEVCKKCGGNGLHPGTGLKACPTCRGTGRIEYRQFSMFGTFVNVRVCPECQGVGQTPESPCLECRGSGRVRERAEINLEIPAGVEDGAHLIFWGMGNAGVAGGPRGDLHVVVEIQPHPIFARQGQDLWVEVPVHYGTLVLGGKIRVPTLSGEEEIEVPPGTDPEEILVLRGRGLPGANGRGDLKVKLRVFIPKKIGREERRLLAAFTERLSPPDPPRRPEL